MLLGLNALVSEQRLYAFDHGQTARFIAVFEAPVYGKTSVKKKVFMPLL